MERSAIAPMYGSAVSEVCAQFLRVKEPRKPGMVDECKKSEEKEEI